MIEFLIYNDWKNKIKLQNEPPVGEPPNRQKKPPFEEPEDTPQPPPPPAEPPVKEPPSEPEKPPVKEPPPKDPDREPPQKPPIRVLHSDQTKRIHTKITIYVLSRIELWRWVNHIEASC
ncbi:MAG: hypothetical protein PVH28_02345 [Desulfobacterales bacterium]